MISRLQLLENLTCSPEKRQSVRSSRVILRSPLADLDFNVATVPAQGYKGEPVRNEYKNSGL